MFARITMRRAILIISFLRKVGSFSYLFVRACQGATVVENEEGKNINEGGEATSSSKV
jgi:hypothetical protein